MPEAVPVGASDEELAERLAGGDQAAFAELVDRHQRRVRTLCWRMTGRGEEAEDLAQETFLRVFRHRDAYQPGRPFESWLKRICVNVCLTHQENVRRRGPVLALGDADAGPVAVAAAVAGARDRDPEAKAFASDAASKVQRVVQAVTEPYRTALVLRVFGGLSYQEIAAELGCSVGTVMSRLSRARALAKHLLEDEIC